MNKNDMYGNKNTDAFDIPDFVEEKTNSDSTSIDMSIFKMSDDELYEETSDTRVYQDDFDVESVPRRKKASNTPLIICLVIIFLLLLSLAGLAYYALNQHRSYVQANTSYLQMQANENNYKKQISDQAAIIEDLNKQLQEAKNPAKGEGSLIYVITDGPIAFRNGNSRDADFVTYNGEDLAYDGEEFKVIEVVNDKDEDLDFRWAKVADGVYFCIGTSEEDWAKPKE